MEIISIILLISLLLFFIYKIIKPMCVCSTTKVKLTTGSKQLKWAKTVYFLCSIPILLVFLNGISGLVAPFTQPVSRWVSGHAFGELFAAVIISFLTGGFLMLNYNFIKVAYKRKIAEKKSIVFFACLPGISCFAFFLPGELAILGIPFLIIAPICNAYILSQSKKNIKSDIEN